MQEADHGPLVHGQALLAPVPASPLRSGRRARVRGHERREDVQRQREDDRGALVGPDLEQRLQVAQLQRGRLAAEDRRGVGELLRRLELALGVDDLRAPLALGLGLAGHRPLHRLGDLDVLDLDDRDLDAPRLGLLVDDLLQLLVEPLALGQELVEVGAAEHGAQRRLGDLRGGRRERLDRRHRRRRVDDAEVADRGDPGRDVVARDQLLGRDRHRDRPQVDAHHPVHAGPQGDEPGPADRQQPAEAEHHGPLVLAQDAQAEQGDRRQDDRERRRGRWSRRRSFRAVLRGPAAAAGGRAAPRRASASRSRGWGPGSSPDARRSRAAASARRPRRPRPARRARRARRARGCGPCRRPARAPRARRASATGRGGSGRPRSAATGRGAG